MWIYSADVQNSIDKIREIVATNFGIKMFKLDGIYHLKTLNRTSHSFNFHKIVDS